jgi:hypothetical protein
MWTDPEQTNTDTGERRTLVKKKGVIGGQIVACWVVPNDGDVQPIETPKEDE